jgi:hypothetical protein
MAPARDPNQLLEYAVVILDFAAPAFHLEPLGGLMEVWSGWQGWEWYM